MKPVGNIPSGIYALWKTDNVKKKDMSDVILNKVWYSVTFICPTYLLLDTVTTSDIKPAWFTPE